MYVIYLVQLRAISKYSGNIEVPRYIFFGHLYAKGK